jgi:hypothetical protein
MPAAYPGLAGRPPPVDVLYRPGQHGLAGIQPATLAGATKQTDQFAPLCLLDPIKVE